MFHRRLDGQRPGQTQFGPVESVDRFDFAAALPRPNPHRLGLRSTSHRRQQRQPSTFDHLGERYRRCW